MHTACFEAPLHVVQARTHRVKGRSGVLLGGPDPELTRCFCDLELGPAVRVLSDRAHAGERVLPRQPCEYEVLKITNDRHLTTRVGLRY